MTTTTTTVPAIATTKRKAKKIVAGTTPAFESAPTAEGLHLSIAQNSLKRGLAQVSHAVAGKSTLPVLSNVLLAIDGDRLKLTATDLSIAVTVWLDATVSAAGTTTLPAKLLADVVGHLPNDTIALALTPHNETMSLTCGRFETSIKGIEAEEFPVIPTMADRTPAAQFASDALREAIRQVAVAAASDDTRPVLAGVLIRLKGNEATFVAADSFRMAVRTLTLAAPVAEVTEVIVPAHALRELGRLLADVPHTVAMTIAPAQGHVLFATEDVEVMTRVIEGKYPDYARIIPTSWETRTVVETAALQQAVRLASYIASSGSKSVRLAMQSGEMGATLTIHATAAQVGDNTGAIEATVTGAVGTIALNVGLLADAIGAAGTAQIAIEMQTPQHAAVFKPVGAEGYLHLLMPMIVR